ncbi:hypothetical protein ACFL1X_01850 [Candidatus Hydrogenedentota bacterium]
MKLDDLAFRIVQRTMDLLEREYHYKIGADARHKIADEIKSEMNDLVEGS